MTHVRADFTALGGDGRLRTTQRRASQPVTVGDRVTVEDPAENVSFPAVVAACDDDGRISLNVDWSAS